MIGKSSLSLRWRVIVASIVTLLVFFSLAGVGLQRAYSDSLDNAAESELRVYMMSLLGAMDVDEAGNVELYDLPINALNQPNSGVYAEVWKEDELMWRSGSLIGKSLPRVESILGEYQFYSALAGDDSEAKQDGEIDVEANVLSFLVDWADEEVSHQFGLVIANDARSYIQRQSNYKDNLLFWLFGLGACLLVLQLLLFKWLFKPVVQVRAELTLIQEGEQADFVGEYPPEVSVLTKSLNTFLSSERKQIKRVKHSLGNLAHSLKTPLAAIRSGLSDKTFKKELLEQQVDRIASVVDYQLNKTSSSIRPSYRRAQPCSESIQRLVDVMRKLHESRGVVISSDINSSAEFYGDVDDLMEIVGNLLENACKWADSQVVLTVENISSNKLAIKIIDNGPGVPLDKVDDILMRGKRLDEAIEGQGIGLAMVNDLIDSYAGELSLEPSVNHQAGFNSGLAVLVVV